MAMLLCENITPGLRASEAVAAFTDVQQRRHFIRAERDFLLYKAEGAWLPVDVVNVDRRSKFILIELPHEAETGANRLWIKQQQLDEPVEALL